MEDIRREETECVIISTDAIMFLTVSTLRVCLLACDCDYVKAVPRNFHETLYDYA